MISSDQLTIVSTFGSLILSGLLVFLYYRQFKIQKAQHNLMEIGQSANIDIEDWDLEGETFSFTISNHGGGASTWMGVDVTLLNRDGDPLYGGSAPLRKEQEGAVTYSTALAPHEKKASFDLNLEMTPFNDEGPHNLSIRDVLDTEIEASKNNYLYLQMSLFFDDQIEGRVHQDVLPYPVFARKGDKWELRSELTNPEPGEHEPGEWHPFTEK